MEKNQVKYQSKAELMFHIQLKNLKEDIELSEGRIEGLKRVQDDVALRMEREMYGTLLEKKVLIEKLIKLEARISSGVKQFVTTGYLEEDGTQWGEQTYISEIKEQEVAV
ncbi:hypothetical protein ACQUY5_20115 [Bacillus cereus]|uniref:hypothetical protein n=1 Tax=Bacillus cereus TaxID=1396 RepID=UPI003D186C2D